jgi:DNA-directed RNA polymerase specialized sigma24 family protein
MAREKPYWNDVDRAILRGRADGLTFAQIGKTLRMSRQAVHSRLQALRRGNRPSARPPEQFAVIDGIRETNRLLAALIVQVARTQTHSTEYHVDVLAGLGLRARQIAEALGTTEATINTMKSRVRQRNKSATSDDAVDPDAERTTDRPRA